MPDAEKILSQHEVDALLSAIDSGAGEVPADTSAAPYDFRRPLRLSGERLRGIETIHEEFARSLQAALSGLLRGGVEVKVAGVHQGTLKEFLHSLPRPTVFAALSAEPLEGAFFLEINASVAWPMIERLLGSARVGGWPQDRPLSPLEWNVIDTVLVRATERLREAWAPVASAEFKVVRRESDPTVMPLPDAGEAAVSVVLEVVIGDQRGCLNLGFSLRALEGRLVERPSAWPPGPRAADPQGGAALSERLAPAAVRLEASLPVEDVRLREIRELRPGDLLVTHHPHRAPVVVSVEGRPKFEARLGRLKDRKAVHVVGPVSPGESGAAARPVLEIRGAPGPSAAGGARPEGSAPAAELVGHLLRLSLVASAVLAEKPMRLRDVLALRPGSLIEFPRRAEDPLELRAAGRAVAEGSVVRVGDRFGLRLTSVRDPRERVRALGP
jgi:flagellar motor switch protein FliM